MTTNELIQKFKDKNGIMENDMIVGMIAYGSRVNNYAKESSDLDVMLITDSRSSYVARQKLDGVIFDINIMSLNIIEYLIEYDGEHNDRYYASVFNTGKVEKNVDGVMDYLRDGINLDYTGGIKKREIKRESLVELGKFYWTFVDSEDDSINEDYLYYNLLELIRQNYNYVHNCSRLNFTKTYDLFINNSILRKIYQLKMPKQDFMNTYLEALNTKDKQKRKEILDKLLGLIDVNPNYLDSDEIGETMGFDNNKVQCDIVYLRGKLQKVEEMIISNHPVKYSVYYIILYRLKTLIMQIDEKEALEMEDEFNEALVAQSDDDKIKSLEAIFAHLDKKFNIDYDNYLIKKY